MHWNNRRERFVTSQLLTMHLLFYTILQISIFFDLLFMLQHYVLYPGKRPIVSQKADDKTREALIAPPDRPQSEDV